MAKKNEGLVSISRDELKKLPRNEQRRYIDLGMVKADAPKAEAKAK